MGTSHIHIFVPLILLPEHTEARVLILFFLLGFVVRLVLLSWVLETEWGVILN
jgi:hypothetical protein